MTTPKEPNFFSDDTTYALGMDWYESLFSEARPDDIKGEASTHYTKLPTYPECISRMSAALSAPKLVYLIRNPLDRAVSHYIHEWSMGVIDTDIETAIGAHPELISYGCYAAQVTPFIQAFGAENIHITSLETMKKAPQETLNAVCRFLGYSDEPLWQSQRTAVNVSSERVRRFPLHDVLIDHPLSQKLRRLLVPQGLRDRIRRSRQIQSRPELSQETQANLREVFMKDYDQLQSLFPLRTDLVASYSFPAQ